MVIHAEIPGSLENYLQEAGRAGRDRKQSRCILLYDENDVESQFNLSAHSRLSRQDIAGILRTLRRYAGKTKSTESLADVDLGFGGRQASGHAYHRAVEQLDYAEALDIIVESHPIELRCRPDKTVVGRLSKKFALPAGKIVAVSLDALVRRHHKQSSPDHAHRDKVPEWWVVLATIVIE